MKQNKLKFLNSEGLAKGWFASPPFMSAMANSVKSIDDTIYHQECHSSIRPSITSIAEHRGFQKDMENSKSLYADIFDLLPTGNLILNSESRILNVNKNASELLGETISNLMGVKFSNFIASKQRGEFDHYYKIISKSDHTNTFEVLISKRDGSNFHAMLSSNLINKISTENPTYLISIIDITDRVKAENIISDHEKFQENIFNAIQDGISVLDSHLTILQVNSTMNKWYPHTTPLQGKKCFEAYHGRKSACDICPSMRALKNGTIQKEIVPWIIEGKNNGWLELFSFPLFDEAGQPKGVVEHVRNVTDRIHAEHALRDNELKFRTMVDHTYSWEYWIDPTGKYVYMTPSSERVTGYRPEAFYNDPNLLQELVHPQDKKYFIIHTKEESNFKRLNSIEFRIFDRKGNKHWISHICQPVFSKEGHFIGRRASNRDITTHKKAEKLLRKSSERLEKEVYNRTKELQLIANQMKDREKELLRHKSKLEEVNRELFETNKAVTVLARNIERSRKDAELGLSQRISSKIIPIIDDLKNVNSLENIKTGLNLLSSHIAALTDESKGNTQNISKLTLTEIKVATLIMNGFTSREIANKLFLSLHTIKTHRRNIRKKLNIQNLDVNLVSYLKTIMP